MILSLLAATWHYNLWDELILLQEYKILKDYFWEETKFNIFTYEEKSSLLPENENIKYLTYFPKNIRKNPIQNIKYLWQNIASIYKSDIVIIGWGWLIYSSEVQRWWSPIWQWKLRILIAKLFWKKIFWLAVGISYPQEKLKDLKFLFSGKKTYVSVRDKSSQKLLEKIGIKATLLSDPVFSFSPVISNLIGNLENKKNVISNFDKYNEDSCFHRNDNEVFCVKEDEKKLIWISLRKGYLKDEIENIKQLILFLSKKWYEIVFISHSIHQDDKLADDYVFVKDITKTYWIRVTKTIEETLEIYPNLNFVIGMRFHSMILSIIYNIPFIALSYWVKTQELLKEFSHENFSIDPKNFCFEDFIRKFEELEKQENEVKFALKSKYDIIKSDFYLNYNNFFDGLESSKK